MHLKQKFEELLAFENFWRHLKTAQNGYDNVRILTGYFLSLGMVEGWSGKNVRSEYNSQARTQAVHKEVQECF